MKTTTIFLSLFLTVLSNPVNFFGLSVSRNKFAASIYREVANQNKENFLVSPLSAEIILALSQAGAEADTARELQAALQLPHQKQLIDFIIADLMQSLQDQEDYVLQTINKIYLKENCSIRSDFRAIAQEVYRAETENIDFSDRNQAADAINKWVEAQTDNKIRNLIDPQTLCNETTTIFLNALRFRANWTIPFQFFSTRKQDFYTSNSDEAMKVETMHMYEEHFEFYEKLNASFLELPIVGGNISMTLVLPNSKDGLVSLEERIDEVLDEPEWKSREIFNVALPKFKLESRIDFKDVLRNLGVEKAFEDGEADFSGIAGEKGELFISDIVQKTFMQISEDGVDAAAATFVVKIANRNAETPREFTVNHPFLFFVKINELVVFIGRVTNP